MSVFVDTYGSAALDRSGVQGEGRRGQKFSDAFIASKVNELFDLRPARIIERFGLKKPIYEPTAAYGHVGRKPYKAEVELVRHGVRSRETVQFFGWELLDSVDQVKKAFGL